MFHQSDGSHGGDVELCGAVVFVVLEVTDAILVTALMEIV